MVRGSPAAWKSRRQSHLPAMRPWRNSRCGVTRSGAKEVEELHWTGVKLKRGSRSTAGRRGSAGAAVEGALFRAGWLLGLRQPLAWGVGAGRCGLERLKEGEPGIAEGRRGIRIPATSPVISGGRCGAGKEGGEEGANARARHGRESERGR